MAPGVREMSTTRRSSWLLTLVVLAAGIGIIDAATARTWDLVAVFGVIMALAVAAASGLPGGRRVLTLRPDLAHWLALRAAAAGEPPDRVADRAIAAYRAGMTDQEPHA
ncbi:hypothetical protein NWFMUON74_38390 [Nocardia wallacei]|uniref:Uncharacterized protein n=2 Tax=Nocardia wallacei TaxID=480035 RepID=A0A7G1KLC6_9NOCA|nr:hypothetical protein NWFMUON74_38390 [Nocardia wallacei]